MRNPEILGLGYMAFRTRTFDDWRDFGARVLGMQSCALSNGLLGFRMDERAHRILLRNSNDDGLDCCGWEVAGAKALDMLAARVENAGHAVTRMGVAQKAERQVADGVCFNDPAGNRIELFYGQAKAGGAFMSGRPISGFRTGALGMGHIVLNVARIDAVLPFYRDLLGFRLSDYTQQPFKAFFLHVNRRHHSLALIENEHVGVHHLMVELVGLDDVGQGYDIAQIEHRVAATLGRHSNDHMTSFYVRTPSRFMIEYGWGGRDIDTKSWQPTELVYGPSLWGHDRDWLSEELKEEARRLRMYAAAQGKRAPLQVMAGVGDLGIWSDVPKDNDERESDDQETHG